jgi:hypothetical protein
MPNDKKEEKEKEGSFDPRCVADIYDKLSGHNYALRALGALLRSSALDDFADPLLGETLKSDNFKAADLRWGLSQIIDLYLAHQEMILKGYVDQYFKSDYELVRRSKSIIEMVDQGGFTTKDAAANALREAVGNLSVVIDRGGALKENAEKLKEECLTYLRQLRGKVAEGG